MSIREIAKLGNPILRQQSQEVAQDEIGAPHIQGLIDDMIDTLRHADAAGLAAPQVSELKQVVVIEVTKDGILYPGRKIVPLTVLINPKILLCSDTTICGGESCLSARDLSALVSRPSMLHIDAFDRYGNSCAFEATGFAARLIHHEVDHLTGVLFTDRLTSSADLICRSELHFWQDTWVQQVEVCGGLKQIS